jgi:U3 small nucleolar RNA-associated protein 11
MSSLRNAVKRKTHKERAQPSKRAKFGLLEKSKDYRLRARDYRRKKGRIRVLKEKAEYRNPDEFYMSMSNARTKDGVHVGNDEAGGVLSSSVLKGMRAQDGSYEQTKLNEEALKISKLQSKMTFLSKNLGNKHVHFVEKRSEVDSFAPPQPDVNDDAAALESAPAWTFADSNDVIVKRQMKKLKRQNDRSYKELSERIAREEKLNQRVRIIDLQKKLGGKGRRKKMQDGTDGNPPVYRWKRERKR